MRAIPPRLATGQAIDLEYEHEEHTGDVYLHTYHGKESALYKQNPVWQEVVKVLSPSDLDRIENDRAYDIRSEDGGWWWANALTAMNEKDPFIWNKTEASQPLFERGLNEPAESLLEPGWLRALREKGADVEAVKQRVRKRFEAVYRFQPDAKKP